MYSSANHALHAELFRLAELERCRVAYRNAERKATFRAMYAAGFRHVYCEGKRGVVNNRLWEEVEREQAACERDGGAPGTAAQPRPL